MNMKHYKTYVQIGLNILHYRKEKGMTQMQLAEMISFSRNHIQRIETATSVPSIAALIEIADALETSVQKLFEFR